MADQNAYGETYGVDEDYGNDGGDTYKDADPELGQGGGPRSRPPPPPGKPDGAAKPEAMQVAAPEPSSTEPGWFAKIKIPISYITIFVSVWMIGGTILGVIVDKPEGGGLITQFYFIFFGALMLFVMLPNVPFFGVFNRLRAGVERWARFMSTNWGRGYFMIFICVLAFGGKGIITIITGILVAVCGLLSIWCGRLAATKYNRMREYLAQGKEGDAFIEAVRELAAPALTNGYITESGIRTLVINSGRAVTASEVHAIYCFFDRDRDGEVTMDMFIERLSEEHSLKSL